MKDIAIDADLLLQAYAAGLFPMSEGRGDDSVFWVDPTLRGIIPLDKFRISRSLARAIRRADYRVTLNRDFHGVVAGCADRDETWISERIFELYLDLHRMGFAHSLELRDTEGALIGGVYGVTLGAAFFGESMFSRRRDASKIALAYLVDRLRVCGFQLFDTQFITPHLASLGAIEIPRATYHRALRRALAGRADFLSDEPMPSPQEVLQRSTQTS